MLEFLSNMIELPVYENFSVIAPPPLLILLIERGVQSNQQL